jgi:hypothetical protein
MLVLKKRLQAIDSVREARFGRFLRLEIVPQPAKMVALIRRKQSEDPIGGRALRCALASRLDVVRGHVARVDLDEVVHGDHFHHSHPIDAAGSVLAQHHDDEHQVPRVFGGVFEARSVDNRRSTHDRLQLVCLDEKGYLLRKALVHAPIDYRGTVRLSKYGPSSTTGNRRRCVENLAPSIRPSEREMQRVAVFAGGRSSNFTTLAWPPDATSTRTAGSQDQLATFDKAGSMQRGRIHTSNCAQYTNVLSE